MKKRKSVYRDVLFGMSLLCLMGMSTAGCGEKDVDYIADGQENADTRRTLNAEDGEKNLWEEMFAIDRENGDTVTVKVRTTVGAGPDTSQVIEIKRMALDENAKERITKAVFGDGVSVEDGVYTGDRDGIPYRMRIGENRISLYPADITQVKPEEMDDMEQLFPDELTERPYEFTIAGGMNYQNYAELSEKEAIEIARQFLTDIGLSDRSLCNVKLLQWDSHPLYVIMDDGTRYGGSIVDGYVFYFQQTIQGEEMTQLTDDTDSEGFGTWFQGYDEPVWDEDTRMHTVVCVNDHGVIAADIQNIYEVTSVEEDVSLLPVETIQGIMRNELENRENILPKRPETIFIIGEWIMDTVSCGMKRERTEVMFRSVSCLAERRGRLTLQSI